MPEPPSERRETTTMNRQPPEVIPRQGQRRTAMRRTAVMACSSVAVALIVVGAALYVQRPTTAPGRPGAAGPPSPGASKSTSHPKSEATIFYPSSIPTGTRLPADLMLESAEVPGTFTGNDYPQGGYDGTLDPLVGRCGQGAPLLQLAYGARARSFQLSDGGDVYQVVRQYSSAADATQALDWYRGKVAACPRFDPGGGQRTLTVVARNLAGDESITVRDKASGGTDLHVFVRVRNRLTEIVINPGDATLGIELAQRAAFHLASVQ